MSSSQKVLATALALLLLAVGYGLWTTSPTASAVRGQRAARQTAPGDAVPVIDQNTYLTARRLARLANTAEEQPLAQSAVQLADHELDLAFTAAFRHLEAHPPVLTPEAAQIQERLQAAQKAQESDAQEVKHLTAALAQASEADKPAVQDRLDLAQSQLELSEDEVQEANSDLIQAGGNVHQRIQMMQQEHDAAEHAAAAPPAAAPPGAFGRLRGLVGQIREWLALHDKRQALEDAQQHATDTAKQLAAERAQIAAELAASKQSVPGLSARRSAAAGSAAAPQASAAPEAAKAAPAKAAAQAAAAAKVAATQTPAVKPSATPQGAGAGAPSLLSMTRQIAAEQHRLTLRDQRISARRKLADVYGQWDAVVATQQRALAHAALLSVTIVLVALLLLLFADRWLERLLARAPVDRRQLATLRGVVGVALQIVGVVVILLVLIGMPGQLGTMIGLAGAGLTVALKDFIVAFIGWFVLMGRNGMRVGDWVEINGVSGEVLELGMFRTVLLETGNWTDAGHPTGRRVTFTNSFATAGHYFNFSTSGQWLWDELVVLVPYDRDSHAIAEAISKEVSAATAQSITQAETEWRRAARGQSGAVFSAQPAVAVRPATGGVEIAVRYVTRASERLALRARLYQAAVQQLSQHPGR
jgi:small-conductance mechanosensitive channel